MSIKAGTESKRNPSQAIGAPLSRVDGRLKVSGKAKYAAELTFPNMVHAVVVQSTIARGRIEKFDTSLVTALPGISVFSAAKRPAPNLKSTKKNDLLLFEDLKVHFAGQIIALVVGNTLEEATHGASLVKVSYHEEPANTDLKALSNKLVVPSSDANSKRGDAKTALKSSSVKLTEKYSTPVHTHNPLETFSTTAVWNDDSLTLYDSTQAVFATREGVAEALGMPPKKVRVVSQFIGGGFGCKLSVWAHVPLAAMAAKAVNRPVRLVLRRGQMFGPVGFRPSTQQTISLGADETGKLQAITHDVVSETSNFAEFVETAGGNSKTTYACDNVETSHRLIRLDIGRPTWMRAPGHATGSFALESAMDELAYAVQVDPIELRLRNFAKKDPDSGLPWSSNSLGECYKQGAAKFGWEKRNPAPRSMKRGDLLVGMGMATALHTVWRNPASVSVQLLGDGTALVRTGTQDIGTGTYTVMTQIAAEKLALPMARVKFELGDTNMPESPMSGGSTTAGSVGPVVAMAASAALKKLMQLAVADEKSPLFGATLDSLVAENGVIKKTKAAQSAESYKEIIARTKNKSVEVRIDNKPGNEETKYSMSAFGAHFAEVEVDPDLATVRVSRFVGACSAGRILNPKTARSQIIGGIIFGISMALLEQTITDHNLNKLINKDLAEYYVPVHADIGSIEPIFVEDHDPYVNSLGVKGIGEIGITGASAAIANAIFHATGKRIRDLPITVEKLILA